MSTATLPILEAAILVVAAPLCGVALATRRFRGAVPAAALFAVVLLVSTGWTIAAWGWSAEAVRAVLISHATLAVTGLALAALGAWLGSTFRDPLDAAAFSAGAALVAAFGLFAAGPLAADLPTGVVNAALSASPIVSTASAANVDLLRTDPLYRISPLAHRRFEYPAWYSAFVWYGPLLLISIAGTARSLRKGWSGDGPFMKRLLLLLLLAAPAARGESLAAFDGRCIPAGCVTPHSSTPGILGRRALPAGRLARLGATPDFRHELLGARPAQADQGVSLKAQAGLGGLCRPGRWTPVRVEVDARGQAGAGEVATGEILVEWGDTRVRRAISLASPSQKQFELYIRTPDARDAMTVRLLAGGREIATVEAPVRFVAPADALTVCVAPAWSASGAACSTTSSPDALPRSWRGYAAADDVVWSSGSRPKLTGEQQTALNQWRTVRAIENAETSSPSIGPITPPARALRRAGTAMLVYALAIGVFVGPLSRIRSRSLVVYPAIVALVAVGSLAAIASGRILPGAGVHVSQAAVVQQLAGTKGSLVRARGVAEFPTFGAVEVRATRIDGAIAPRGGRNRQDLTFDENGAPLFTGTYGLGATETFEIEAMTAFEALQGASHGTTVRVSNISTHELRDCRFGTGFSRLNVGSLAPGSSVEAERQGGRGDAVFSCTLAAPVIELTESRWPVDSDGTAVVVLHLPESRPAP